LNYNEGKNTANMPAYPPSYDTMMYVPDSGRN